MIDYFSLFSPDASLSDILRFHDAALAPLGYKRKDFIPDTLVDYAADDVNYDFWIHKRDEQAGPPVHFAFRVQNYDWVHQFHAEGAGSWRHR